MDAKPLLSLGSVSWKLARWGCQFCVLIPSLQGQEHVFKVIRGPRFFFGGGEGHGTAKKPTWAIVQIPSIPLMVIAPIIFPYIIHNPSYNPFWGVQISVHIEARKGHYKDGCPLKRRAFQLLCLLGVRYPKGPST